ncbi:hypothetical protein Pan110_05150 [Gimesia panareensis]|nr:hypothetical protein Pan110_05150 [Gimesia panareensis]
MTQFHLSKLERLWSFHLLLLFALAGLSGCAHNSCGEGESCPSISCRVKKCILFHHDKCSPKPYWSLDGYQTDLDKYFVKYAARKCARESLKTMACNCKDKPSKAFRKGYQEAYIDIALGESGTVPPVPPEEYWAAHYRTPEGYMEVQEWFTGYKLGSEHARADGRYDYNRIATPYSLAGWEQPVSEPWDGNVVYPQEASPSEAPFQSHPAPAPAATPSIRKPETMLPPPPAAAPRTPLKTVPQKHLPQPPPLQVTPEQTRQAHPRPLIPQPKIKPRPPVTAPKPSFKAQHSPLPKPAAKQNYHRLQEPASPAYINDDPPPSPYSLQSYPYTPLPGTEPHLETRRNINQIGGQRLYQSSVIDDYPFR